MNTLDRIPHGGKFAVIRLRSLGDCVLTTPAIALLKQYRPDLQISVVVEDRFAGVFEGNPDITEISPQLRSRPDAVLNLHGGTRSMTMVATSRAPIRAGFAHHSFSRVYNCKIPRAQEILGEERPVHTAEHLASAMFYLGVPKQEIPRAKLFANTVSVSPAPYVAIHPFASRPDKAWPAERFLEIIHMIRSKHRLNPIVLAGPGDDVTPFEGLSKLVNAPLGQVKSALASASLFVGNDSGPAHIAAAFGVPSVVMFGPSNPLTWAPWRTEAQVLTSSGPIAEISAEAVLAACGALRVSA